MVDYLYVLDNSITLHPDSKTFITGLSERKKLRPQCYKLLLLLMECKIINCIATYEMIGETLWRRDGGWDVDKKQSLKDCVAEINKIYKCVESVRGEGYVLSCSVLKVPLFPCTTLEHHSTRGWNEFYVERLELKELEVNRQLEYISIQIKQITEEINQLTKETRDKKQDVGSRLLLSQLGGMQISVDGIKCRIPYMRIDLKEISKEIRKLVKSKKTRNSRPGLLLSEDRSGTERQIMNILNWCLEAKLELDKDRTLLLEYRELVKMLTE